jgi:hypothetical protein
MESYSSYRNKATTLLHNQNNGNTDATAEQWNKDMINNVMQFFKMLLF